VNDLKSALALPFKMIVLLLAFIHRQIKRKK